MKLKIASLAPSFNGFDNNGVLRSTNDLINKSLVLFSYPKDNSPGCTSQVCSFRDNFHTFRSLNAEVGGINNSDIKSHQKFSKDFYLPFPLINDKDNKIKNIYGFNNIFGISLSRVTFVINNSKKIILIYENLLDSNSHIKESLKVLEKIS